jgi:hypothetical protein
MVGRKAFDCLDRSKEKRVICIFYVHRVRKVNDPGTGARRQTLMTV